MIDMVLKLLQKDTSIEKEIYCILIRGQLWEKKEKELEIFTILYIIMCTVVSK